MQKKVKTLKIIKNKRVQVTKYACVYIGHFIVYIVIKIIKCFMPCQTSATKFKSISIGVYCILEERSVEVMVMLNV